MIRHILEKYGSSDATIDLLVSELENHLSVSKDKTDKVKARRIIERIKNITEDIEIVGKNRRQL